MHIVRIVSSLGMAPILCYPAAKLVAAKRADAKQAAKKPRGQEPNGEDRIGADWRFSGLHAWNKFLNNPPSTRAKYMKGLLRFEDWKELLYADCMKEGKISAFNELDDHVLKLFYDSGIEPTVAAIAKDGDDSFR